MDDYSAARSEIIPPLLWPTFSPPFSLRFDGKAITVRDTKVVGLMVAFIPLTLGLRAFRQLEP